MRRIDTEELESYLTKEELDDVCSAHGWAMYRYRLTHFNTEKANKYFDRLYRQLLKAMVEDKYGIKSR